MADTLVLASLQVDASGVVSGMGASNRALGQGERALENFGRSGKRVESMTGLLVTKMFSLRSALLAVTRVLGIAGIVLALAHAVVSLTKEVITSTTWFKQAAAAVTDWWQALVHGEDSLGRLSRKLEEHSKGTGVESIGGDLKRMQELLEKRATLPLARTPEEVRVRRIELEKYNKEIEQLAINLGKVGISARQVGALEDFQRAIAQGQGGALKSGTTVDMTTGELVPQRTLDKEAAEEAKKRAEALRRLTQAQTAANAAALIGRNESMAQLMAVDDWMVALRQLQDQAEGLVPGVALMADEMQIFSDMIKQADANTKAWMDSLSGFEEQFFASFSGLDPALAQFDLFNAALQGVAQTMATTLVHGTEDGKRAIAGLLEQISAMCFTYSLMFAAMAIGATTVAGAAALGGTPSQFGKAAAGFAAAGVAAGLAARALGGGGGGGREGGGGGGAAGAQAAPASARTLTIVVQGSVIGTDPDDLARELLRLQRTATGDGG